MEIRENDARAAVLDSAHVGDIRGALGTIHQDDIAPRTGWKQRLKTLLAILGPGLIVMVGDNDAGAFSTYTAAGQNYGTSLLWTLALLIPVIYVNQEMVLRLGSVTRVGHGGVEKAVHHYAAENYPQLEKILQCKPGFLVPGILGENISTLGWDERSVCIGDVFAIGQVRLQVSQPRSPCWKINRRLEIDSASKAMVQARLTGWYYRVLACGSLAEGDRFELLQRARDAVSIDYFLQHGSLRFS